MIGVAYGTIPDSELWIRALTLFIGVLFVILMLISLVRHRMYQDGSKQQMKKLFDPTIKGWDEEPRKHRGNNFKIDKLSNWAMSEKISGFKLLVRVTWILILTLVLLIFHTLVQLIQDWNLI